MMFNLKFLPSIATVVCLLSPPLWAMDCGINASKTVKPLRAASWNITADFYDRKESEFQNHNWKARQPAVVTTIKQKNPDILGLQELSPEQALVMAHISGYGALFLSQTPSEIETGLIVEGENVKEWIGKRAGTPLVGILYKNEKFTVAEKGRFWLNENPDLIPTNKDRDITDKGFGNMTTYRAVLWAELTEKTTGRKVFAFNSHYPLSGTHNTRYNCAKVEREKINEIAKDDFWVSMGDRNITRPPKFDDMEAMEPLLQGVYNAVNLERHKGPVTTFSGFKYDAYQNPLIEGKFEWAEQLDVMASNYPSLCSEHVVTQFNPATGEVQLNPDKLEEERNFASDHLMVVADYGITKK